MDIAILFKNNRYEGDIELNGTDLKTGNDLESAIIISLFTDRRANNDDVIIDDDRRGFWGDTYAEIPDDKIGSRLWLLQREKITQEAINKARIYITESLQWLLDDRIAEKINIQVEAINQSILGIKIEIIKPTGITNFSYEYAWRQL